MSIKSFYAAKKMLWTTSALILALIILTGFYFCIGFLFDIKAITNRIPQKYRFILARCPRKSLIYEDENVRFSYLRFNDSYVKAGKSISKLFKNETIRYSNLGLYDGYVKVGRSVLKLNSDYIKVEKSTVTASGEFDSPIIRIVSPLGKKYAGIGGEICIIETSKSLQQAFGKRARWFKASDRVPLERKNKIKPDNLTLEMIPVLFEGYHFPCEIKKIKLKDGTIAVVDEENRAAYFIGKNGHLFIITASFAAAQIGRWEANISPYKLGGCAFRRVLKTIEIKDKRKKI